MSEVYQIMKVSSQNNKVNFTSTPIHKVNLINVKDGSFIPAVFSQLNPNNQLDAKAIKYIQKTWEETPLLTDHLYDDFMSVSNSEQYHVIELVNKAPLEQRIVGLIKSRISHVEKHNGLELMCTGRINDVKALLELNKPQCSLSLLIVKPEFAKKNMLRKIKDIGELLLGEIFNLAKNADASSFVFNAANTDFYNKTFSRALADNYIPHPSNTASHFNMKRDTFDKYLAYWKQKFGITI